MIPRLRTLFHRLVGLFRPLPGDASRSRLVGIYLSQTNGRDVSGSRGAAMQERQNGKFAQNRRR